MSAVEPALAASRHAPIACDRRAAWLLWSLRRLDAEPGADWDVHAFWQRQLGEAASFEIVCALARLLSVLRLAARRQLHLASDDAAEPTAHEASLLAAWRAVQGGELLRLEAHLLWLARPPARADLREALAAAACVLARRV